MGDADGSSSGVCFAVPSRSGTLIVVSSGLGNAVTSYAGLVSVVLLGVSDLIQVLYS